MSKLLRNEMAVAALFLSPSLIGFAIFYLIPFIMGVLYSFQDSPGNGSFVGFHNYESLLESASFRKAAANTFLFTSVCVPLIVALSLFFAHLLNQRLFIRNWLQTAFVMPLVVPVASIVMMWQIVFDWNGTLNDWLPVTILSSSNNPSVTADTDSLESITVTKNTRNLPVSSLPME